MSEMRSWQYGLVTDQVRDAFRELVMTTGAQESISQGLVASCVWADGEFITYHVLMFLYWPIQIDNPVPS